MNYLRNGLRSGLIWITMLFLFGGPVVQAGRIIELKEKYSHDQQAGLYVAGKYGKAIALITSRSGPLYPVLFDNKNVKEGTISAWFKPTRRGWYGYDSQSFIFLSDGRRSIHFIIYSGPTPFLDKRSELPRRFLKIAIADPGFKSNWYQLSAPLEDDFNESFHHLLFTWNTEETATYLDGKCVSKFKRKDRKKDKWLGSFDGNLTKLSIHVRTCILMDELLVLSKFTSLEDAEALYQAAKPWQLTPYTALYAGFDNTLTAKGFLKGDGDLLRFISYVGRPEATFTSADPAEFTFTVINTNSSEKNVVFNGLIKDLKKKIVLEKTYPVKIEKGQIAKIKFDMTDIKKKGLFWGYFSMKENGAIIQKETIPFARSLGVEGAKSRANGSHQTGLVILNGFNPAVYNKWTRLFYVGAWRDIEYAPGKWDFERLDLSVDILVSSGRKPVIVLHGNPGWAAKSFPPQKFGWLSAAYAYPEDIEGWKEYVKKLGKRYKGKVYDYEVWNEPYFRDQDNKTATAENYAKLVNISAEVLHAVDPEIQVSAGMFGPFGLWNRTVACTTAGYADYYTIHPYGAVNPSGSVKLSDETLYQKKVIKVLKECKASTKLANTEFACYTLGIYAVHADGYPMTLEEFKNSGRWEKMPEVYRKRGRDRFVDWFSGAFRVVRGVVLDKALGCKYSLWWSSGGGGAFSSLMYKKYSPSPESLAYTNLFAVLNNFRYLKRLDLGAEYLKAYLFKKDDKLLISVFTDDQQLDASVFLELAGKNLQILDLYGNDYPFEIHSSVIKLNLRPITPLYIKGITKMPETSRPVLKAVSEKEQVYPGEKAPVRVSVYNPLNNTIQGKVTLKLPALFAPLPAKLVTLLPKEAKDIIFKIPVPQTAAGRQKIETWFATNSKVFKTITKYIDLPVSQSSIVKYTKKLVKIDGKLDEWDAPETFTVRIDKPTQVVVGTPHTEPYVPRIDWKGTEDLAGYAALAYDEKNLYIAVRVYDDKLRNLQRSSPIMAYEGDCVELFIDAREQKKQGGSEFTKNVFHIKLAPSTDKELPPFKHFSKPRGKILKGFAFNSVILENGYTMEVKIPLINFPCLKITPMINIGFDIAIDDQDEGGRREGRKSQLMWAGTKDSFANPSVFGKIIFGKEE